MEHSVLMRLIALGTFSLGGNGALNNAFVES